MAVRVSASSSSPSGLFGRIAGTLIFGIFLVAGIFFTSVMGRSVVESLRPWFWEKTESVIVESSAQRKSDEGADEWRAEITYRYTHPQTGERVTSSRVMAKGLNGGAEFSDAGKAYRLARRFPAGSRAFCHVNSRAPAESVLVRSSPWVALSLLFPLVFVSVGAIGIGALWWPRSQRALTALSSRATSGRGSAGARGLFLIFFLFGLGIGVPFFLLPVFKSLQATTWLNVPCTIVSSGVKKHAGSENDTYSVEIHYRYSVAGEQFDGNRFDFLGGSSSGTKSKQAAVKGFRPGSRATCFVNPRDPTDSVLERGLVRDLWFGLIPLAFCVIGFAGFFLQRTPIAQITGLPLPADSPASTDERGGTLQPSSSRRSKLVMLALFAAAWNAAVWFGLMKTDAPWFFRAIFALVGAGLGLAALYQLLACFNPRAVFTVNRRAIRLGDTLEIDWRLLGNTRRIEQLRIWLRGQEEATYRRGTDTVTDKHAFAELELIKTEDRAEMPAGRARVTIPTGTMHTFLAPNNKVVWSIHLRGKIRRWPDLEEEFPITVLPHRP
ncbi:MAG TPA: DUF3592 domain-containing protein [Chthoniobacteraceae bacterium]|jgi:hypothetical protein